MMDEINITELYGACILLKSIIENTTETIVKNDVPVPGQFYLLKRFDELYKLCSESFNKDSYFEKLYYIRKNMDGIIEDMERDLLYNVDKDKWGVYICYVIRI